MSSLSVVIITFNEEANIRRCLESVRAVADEIVVVDSFSKDKTQSICEEFGVKFLQNPFPGHIEQKNFAMNQASNDLVLSLDADEALDDQLKQNILAIKKDVRFDAYSFNRLNFYCGKFIRHGAWYPDRKTRLWNRSRGAWGGENPHDKVLMREGSKIQHVKGNLLHYSYHSIAAHLQQMNKFSDIASKEAFRKGKKANVIVHLVLYPYFTFLKSYVIKFGFLDGYQGFIVALNAGYYRFLKYSKLKELWRENPDSHRDQ